MSRRLTILLLSPDGRGTRRLELGPGVVMLATVALAGLVAGALWLGWTFGAFTAGL